MEAINPRLAVLSQLRVRLAMLEDRSEELPKFIAGFKESSNVDNEIRQVQCMAVAAGLMKNETLSAQASQWRGEAIGRLDRLLSGETSARPSRSFSIPISTASARRRPFKTLRKHKLSRRYDGVWQERKDFETRLLFDVGAAEHERLAKQLAKQHYQVACLDVKAEPPSGQLVMASIWRREVSKAEDRIQAARAIARLAAARRG